MALLAAPVKELWPPMLMSISLLRARRIISIISFQLFLQRDRERKDKRWVGGKESETSPPNKTKQKKADSNSITVVYRWKLPQYDWVHCRQVLNQERQFNCDASPHNVANLYVYGPRVDLKWHANNQLCCKWLVQEFRCLNSGKRDQQQSLHLTQKRKRKLPSIDPGKQA